MTVMHSPQMLLKLEKCLPISHVNLETVSYFANIGRPTSSQLNASVANYFIKFVFLHCVFSCINDIILLA